MTFHPTAHPGQNRKKNAEIPLFHVKMTILYLHPTGPPGIAQMQAWPVRPCTNGISADRWHGIIRISGPGYVDRGERRQAITNAHTDRCRRAVPPGERWRVSGCISSANSMTSGYQTPESLGRPLWSPAGVVRCLLSFTSRYSHNQV